MVRKLVIDLEGASPDLGQVDREGVSLRFFATYAKRLRDAYQRSAQAVLTGTAQETGRLPKRAADVEVRLVDASANSLHLSLVPVDNAAQISLADSLPADALDRFISDMEIVAKDPESPQVPKALRALIACVPGEVRQRYQVRVGDIVERQVELTSTGVAVLGEPVLASVERVNATVLGAICLPRCAVILDTEDGRIQASTTTQWMETAWSLRDRTDLVATIVTSAAGHRMLAIRPAEEQALRSRVPSVEETLQRFDGVLRILAR